MYICIYAYIYIYIYIHIYIYIYILSTFKGGGCYTYYSNCLDYKRHLKTMYIR